MELDERDFQRLTMWLCAGAHKLGADHVKAMKEIIRSAIDEVNGWEGEGEEDGMLDNDDARSILAGFAETWDEWDRKTRTE